MSYRPGPEIAHATALGAGILYKVGRRAATSFRPWRPRKWSRLEGPGKHKKPAEIKPVVDGQIDAHASIISGSYQRPKPRTKMSVSLR